MRTLYMHYFDLEMSIVKGQIKKTEAELHERSYIGCLAFCKDFKFMPYMLSQRVCAFLWYTVANIGFEDNTISEKSRNQELSNNVDQKRVISKLHSLGRTFTFAHFIIFFFRLAILSFDLCLGVTDPKLRNFNLIKKLLRILK